MKRWAIVLSEFDFKIVYTKGKQHCDVDCLSRAPVDDPTDPYLEEKVYLIQPFDKDDWTKSYTDPQLEDILLKASQKIDDFKLIEDIIYKNDTLYVPELKRREIIKTTHETPSNAHPGINATLAKLKQNYFWPNMRELVSSFIQDCTICLRQKADRHPPAGSMNSFEIFAPSQRIALDLIEDLTESHNGNNYIIVAIDMFTRFIET